MKKLKINLLPIIGMMVAVATLAFTAPKENTVEWYDVTVDAQFPNDESLQIINGTTSAPSSEDNCRTDITGFICKVKLDLHDTATVPGTMADARQAEDDGDLTVEDEANTVP